MIWELKNEQIRLYALYARTLIAWIPFRLNLGTSALNDRELWCACGSTLCNSKQIEKGKAKMLTDCGK